jgi:hypothetical protein
MYNKTLLVAFFSISNFLVGFNKVHTTDDEKLLVSNKAVTSIENDSAIINRYIGNHLIINYAILDSGSILLIENTFNIAYDKICKLFGNFPSQKIVVKVYPSMKMLLDAEHIYGYIGGIVTGSYSMSVVSPKGLDIFNKPINMGEQLKVIPHEFIHNQIHKINYSTVTWLNEGTAYFLANQGSFFKNSSSFHDIINQIWENKTPSITDLEKDYESFFKIDYSLQFSYLMVEFIDSKYGINQVIELIKNNCDLQKTIGISKDDLNKQWIDYLKRTYKQNE